MSQVGETVKDTAHASYQQKEDMAIPNDDTVTFREDITKRFNNLPTAIRGEKITKPLARDSKFLSLFKDE